MCLLWHNIYPCLVSLFRAYPINIAGLGCWDRTGADQSNPLWILALTHRVVPVADYRQTKRANERPTQQEPVKWMDGWIDDVTLLLITLK